MNGEFLQDPFTIYKTYCGIKLHFTTLKYDYTKYLNYKVSEKTFKKRNDIIFFYSMAQILQKSDNVPFFVSQFIETPNWIGNFVFEKEEAMKKYTSWANRFEHLKDNYVLDLHTLAEKGYTWEKLLTYSYPNHPILFQLVSQKIITPETYVLIDILSNFISATMKAYANDTLYTDLNLKFLKYRSFLPIDKKIILKYTPKDLTNVC